MRRALSLTCVICFVVAGSAAAAVVPAAATSTSDLYRWGSFGLGPKANNEAATPVPVGNVPRTIAIAAGNASDMALDFDGHVWTWGDGTDGVLGDGSTTDHISDAVQVVGLPTIVKIAEADNTDVALDSTGHVWGWGWNESGQLCLGNRTDYDTPQELPLSGVEGIAGAGAHILYLLTDGSVEACGDNNYGQLGDGTFSSSTVPVAVEGLPGAVSAVSAGQVESTALLSNGQVWDWGYNAFGQLGDGTTTSADVAMYVDLPTTAREVYTGGDEYSDGQSLALLSDGTVWGWGNDRYGQLGDGKTADALVPVQASKLPSGKTWTAVASGGTDSLAIDSDGNVWAWGNNVEGQVGVDSPEKVTTPVEILAHAQAISATADDAVARVALSSSSRRDGPSGRGRAGLQPGASRATRRAASPAS
jgi:alpha-tubulin suppressor-like RCC1 family protein